jgi:hypothetical protein
MWPDVVTCRTPFDDVKSLDAHQPLSQTLRRRTGERAVLPIGEQACLPGRLNLSSALPVPSCRGRTVASDGLVQRRKAGLFTPLRWRSG